MRISNKYWLSKRINRASRVIDLKWALTVAAVGALADSVDVVDTGLTVGMLAHEVHCGETQFTLAGIARLFVVEIDRSLFHFGNFAFAGADLGELLVES